MASLPAAAHDEECEEQARWLELQGATFANRPEATAAILNFVTFVQHRHAVNDPEQSGKLCAAYKCTGCNMRIRARGRANGDWKVVALSTEHINCSARMRPRTSQLAALSSVSTRVVAHGTFPVSCSLCPSVHILTSRRPRVCRTDAADSNTNSG